MCFFCLITVETNILDKAAKVSFSCDIYFFVCSLLKQGQTKVSVTAHPIPHSLIYICQIQPYTATRSFPSNFPVRPRFGCQNTNESSPHSGVGKKSVYCRSCHTFACMMLVYIIYSECCSTPNIDPVSR